MKVFLATLGCRLNEAEIGRWRRQLHAAGHQVVDEAGQADRIVVNSCAVTADGSKRSRQLTRQLHRQAPHAPITLTGCMATLETAAALALDGVQRVVPNIDKDRLVEQLDLGVGAIPAAPNARRRTRGFVKVQDGCRHRCTFCIVTVARGEERSRTIDEVVADIVELEAEGVHEVVLSGVHLGGWGGEWGQDLSRLLEAVLARTSVPRIRLGSLEPWDLPDGFFGLWSDPRMCPHLHLPVQSGSNSVLRRMARRCSRERFLELAGAAHAQIPGFHLSTDLMVGFPGETEAELEDSITIVEQAQLGHAHVFAYSARQGTAAARMAGQLPGDEKRRRSARLRAVVAERKAARLAREVGASHEVLWERTGRSGYTPSWFRVEGEGVPGTVTEVRVTGVADGERLIVA